MKAIRETANQDLQWAQLKWWKQDCELRSGDEVLAMLYKDNGPGNTIGEAADGRWAFKRRSLWKADILITELTSQAEIAVVKRGRKQSLVFSDGRILTLNKLGFLRNEWDWIDGDGTPLIHFLHGKRVVLEPLALSLPELSLLVIVGWHLILLQQAEAADAAAASSVSG